MTHGSFESVDRDWYVLLESRAFFWGQDAPDNVGIAKHMQVQLVQF